MSLVFALLASLGFGVGDFAATVGARRHSPLLVAFVAQGVGLLCALMVAPLFSLHLPTLVQCEWAAGAGLFGAAAFLVCLWALTNGPIGVVAPISAVVSVVVPIVVGLFGGERPTAAAWIGVTLAVSAIIMLSTGGTSGHATPRVVLGAIATGLGFGVFYVLFRKAGDGSGIWPVVIARLASVAVQFGLIRSRATIGVKAVAVDRL